MRSITISEDYIVNISGTSDGNQDKYYKDGIWYNLSESEPQAKPEFRFTYTGALNEGEPKAMPEFSGVGYGIRWIITAAREETRKRCPSFYHTAISQSPISYNMNPY